MYHKIEHQELHPEKYELAEIAADLTEDECFYKYSKPRQTQASIGLYLKKKKDNKRGTSSRNEDNSSVPFRPDPEKADPYLESRLLENKGFWVDKPTITAPLINKLTELHTVQTPKKDNAKGQGIFYRPYYLEQEYLTELGKAGLLYPDEDITDSEDEVKPDETMCIPLRRKKYKICDPCKSKPERKNIEGKLIHKDNEIAQTLKKIPTGCQCNYFGCHNTPYTVWDFPYRDESEMIRQHEMDKYLRPFKKELLNKSYELNPPLFIPPDTTKMKRIFSEFMVSNL